MLVSCGRVMLCVAVLGQGFRLAFFVSSALSFEAFLGSDANHISLAIVIEAIQSDWMDFAVLSVLQAIYGFVGWYEESNASNAIKALRKNLAGVQCETQWPWIVA